MPHDEDKFALQLIWLANQLDVEGMMEWMCEMVEAIRQSWVVVGFWSARVTVRESPSKIKEDIFRKRAKWTANKVALALPKRVVHGELIRELYLIIAPEEFLMTAAWSEKERRIAVS